jgi:hypothetical protein
MVTSSPGCTEYCSCPDSVEVALTDAVSARRAALRSIDTTVEEEVGITGL